MTYKLFYISVHLTDKLLFLSFALLPPSLQTGGGAKPEKGHLMAYIDNSDEYLGLTNLPPYFSHIAKFYPHPNLGWGVK